MMTDAPSKRLVVRGLKCFSDLFSDMLSSVSRICRHYTAIAERLEIDNESTANE